MEATDGHRMVIRALRLIDTRICRTPPHPLCASRSNRTCYYLQLDIDVSCLDCAPTTYAEPVSCDLSSLPSLLLVLLLYRRERLSEEVARMEDGQS